MSLTKVDIINGALLQLGHESVSSLEDGDALVVAAEKIYDLKLPSVLAMGNWRFAAQISQLTQLVTTPPEPWETIYSLPAGYLKTIRLYPQMYSWEIYANKQIYTLTSGELWMEYIYQPDVSLFPPYFVDYFTYEISSNLALSNAEKTDYFSVLENQRRHMLAMANAIDSQNRPNFSQAIFPVINNRFITGIIDGYGATGS